MALKINIAYDASVNSAPVGFQTAVQSVVTYFEGLFADPISLTINVGWGEVNGQSLSVGALAESSFSYLRLTYGQLINVLNSDAKTPADRTAFASLPSTSPVTGQFLVTAAEAKSLGISRNSITDGSIGFSTTASYDFDRSNGITSSQVDFFAAFEHELSEIMGRALEVGTDNGSGPGYTAYDLFHYSSAGVRDFVGTQPGYFSIDSGNTNLNSFNTDPAGDFGDWASTAGNDADNAFARRGVINAVSKADLIALDVLGWDLLKPALHDFDGDGRSDVLWQNDSGQAGLWLMNGATILSGPTVGGNPGTSWHVIGSGDFNGDGYADFLWQNDNGQAAIWLMNGSTILSGPAVGPNSGYSWHVKSAGDFDGDGKADILWQNDSGQVGIWLMNGTTVLSGPAVGNNSDPSWHVIGTGDFDGNGKADILWQNDSGQAGFWFMNGTNVISGPTVGGNPGPSWHVKGAGDFDGDGKSDILWQNDSGQVGIWLMNGATVRTSPAVGNNLDPSWQVKGTGDINGDGMADIIWQNTNGQAGAWLMSSTNVLSAPAIGANPGTSWQIIAGTGG